MIERYSRPEMTELFQPEKRFQYMLYIEKELALVQASLKLIPRKAALEIHKKAKFNLARISEIEAVTKHDVTAFVNSVRESLSAESKAYVHFGVTSSDILDSALSLQWNQAGALLKKTTEGLLKAVKSLSLKHQKSLCLGRTHGMAAEPTTFGFKLAGHYAEIKRGLEFFDSQLRELQRIKLSGAVGTYSTMAPEVERQLARKLKMQPELHATQVVPRDRHARVMMGLVLQAAAIERLALELRHLQRSEVSEVTEGFSPGQTGSSVMPHKKNPISSENLMGCARMMRSYLAPTLENVSLWHERDISHSSVERMVFPDAFILLDYMTHRMTEVILNLSVNKEQMKLNLEKHQISLASSHLLKTLVESGLDREEAYFLIQKISQGASKTEEFVIKSLSKHLKRSQVLRILSFQDHIKHLPQRMKEILR